MQIKPLLLLIVTSSFLLAGCATKEENEPKLKKVSQELFIREDSLYEKERKNLLTQTISSPKIPLRTADKILRVLIMPYVDEDSNLQIENFHFIKADEGRWVIGEYLSGQDRSSNPKMLTPLRK